MVQNGRSFYAELLILLTVLLSTSASAVRGDPTLPRYLAVREIKGLHRKKLGLERRGKAKHAMTDGEKRDLREALGILMTTTNTLTSSALDNYPPPAKKQRVSQDQWIATGKDVI